MKLIKKYPVLGSSADPDKVALTVKGAVIATIPLLIMILRATGIEVTETDLVNVVEAGFLAVSGIMVLIGLARKLYIKIKSQL